MAAESYEDGGFGRSSFFGSRRMILREYISRMVREGGGRSLERCLGGPGRSYSGRLRESRPYKLQRCGEKAGIGLVGV